MDGATASLASASLPRVPGVGSRSGGRGKGSPVWRGPTPQQGFATPLQPQFSPGWTEEEGAGDGGRSREGRTPGSGKTPGSSAKKPVKRKGGLSMFLAGEELY
jgi:hypothetical protein